MKKIIALLLLLTQLVLAAPPPVPPSFTGEVGWHDGRRYKGTVGAGYSAWGNNPTTFWLTDAANAGFTLDHEDREIVFLCNGTFTIDLTAAATLGDGFSFVVKNIGAGTITIDPNLVETIDGSLTFDVVNQYDAVQVATDGSNWHIIEYFVGGGTGTGLWKLVGSDLQPQTDGWTVSTLDATAAGSATWSTDVNGDTYIRNTGFRSCIGSLCMDGDSTLYSTCMGYKCLEKNIGNFSTSLGFATGRTNTGIGYTGVGYIAGDSNKGDYSTFLGYSAGARNIGDSSVGIGANTLELNEGDFNSAFGRNAFDNFALNGAAAKTFDNTDINVGLNQITVTGHSFGVPGGFVNLEYTQGTAPITGLIDGVQYQFEIIDGNTLEPITATITAAGSGTGHTLTPQVVYTNSTAVGYNAEPEASNQIMLGDMNVTNVKTYGTITVDPNLIGIAASPSVNFGDGDSGIREDSDDVLRVALAGVDVWQISSTSLGASTSGRPRLLNETASITNPTLIPYLGDDDSGIGGSGSDAISLIAGGVEGLRIIESGGATTVQMPHDSYMTAIDNAGTGTVDMFKVNTSDNIEVGATMQVSGNILTAEDAYSTVIDTSVTASAASGTEVGYTLEVDGNNVIGVIGDSDGAGGVNGVYTKQYGGEVKNVTVVNAATYDVTLSDSILHVTYTATGAVTSLTLMSDLCDEAVDNGRIIYVKDAAGNAGTFNITIDTEGSENIDGSGTYFITANYDDFRAYCYNSNWYIMD